MPVVEITITLFAAWLGIYLFTSFLGVIRKKLKALGYPLTFRNVMSLSSFEEAAKREQKLSESDELLLSKELMGPALREEIEDLVESGVSWEQAAEKVLGGGPHIHRKQKQKQSS